MTKKQLFDKLCEGEMPDDRILFRPILMHFAARFIGKTYADLASDYRVLVEANLKALEHFDLDMTGLISDPYRETSAFGAGIEYQQEGVPKCLDILVKDIDDVKQLKNPDVYKAPRTLDRIKGAELFQKNLKGNVPVIGWIEGPLAEACDLAGIDNVLMNLMMNPDFVNSLLDKCMITAKDFAKAQIEAGCDIIGIGDAICSQIDINSYDTYVKNRHAELIKYIHEQGAKVKLHICGNITHLLSSLSEVAPDILDIDWQVDMNESYKILGKDIIRCGNINPVDIQDKFPGEITELSKNLLEQENGRKFIFSGGCEITVGTPHENLMAMRKVSYKR